MFFKLGGFTLRIEQRKIREVYGLYCSVKEVLGVVHFDDFAAAVRSFWLLCSFLIILEETFGFRSYVFIHRNLTWHTPTINAQPQKVDTGVPMGNNATGNAGIPTAAWWPWFMGSFSEEEPAAEVELEQKEKPIRFAREALPMMRKQQINRGEIVKISLIPTLPTLHAKTCTLFLVISRQDVYNTKWMYTTQSTKQTNTRRHICARRGALAVFVCSFLVFINA